MATEEQLQAGIAAARAGDIAKASGILIQVVQANPNSELGWLWLGFCRTAPEQRDYCFRRVLAINPQNVEARRQMEALHTPPEIKPLASSGAPARVPASAEPPREKPVNTPPPTRKATPPKPRKKNNNILIWAGVGLVLCACVAVAGLFVFNRLLKPTNTPVAAMPSPTSVSITPIPNYTPVFEPAPCSFEKTPPARVDCGFVIVPEDRSGDLTDTIRLAVAIYHSTSAAPKPDPVLYLQGGPGDEAVGWSASVYEYVVAPLLSERDFIVFDPRGVGHSQPVLNCEEFGKTYIQDMQGKLPADKKASYYEGALLGCKNHLTQQGAKLSAYTSVDMAADARDVVVALKYQQANLYGISYGTRVAQFVMRNHPGVVRSAILDSVVPVEAQMWNQGSTATDAILRVLFDDCKADPACSAAYPDLEAVYKQAFDQLNAQPGRVTVNSADGNKTDQTINGTTFQNAILWALRVPQTIPLAPRMIYRARDGDNSMLSVPLSFPTLAFDSIALGSYISVNCHDQVFAMPLESTDTTLSDMCKLWDIKPPAPGENDPVSSEIPTLLFAGRYDAATPLALAHQLAGHLPHSTVVEIPNQGHAPSATGASDCPINVISSFLQDPNLPPNLTCVAEIPAIKFVVPYNASALLPLEPLTLAQYQIDTLIPSGWTQADFGFYSRNAFLGDMTQLALQRAAVSESDWLTWLSTKFADNQGFDQPPVKHDERQANGLKWSIYQTSFQGLPVEIALAGSNGQTIMVLLSSYKDEHDALYNMVLLPVLDSTKASR